MGEQNEGAGGRSARVLQFIQKAVQRHGDYYDYSLVTDDDYRSGKVRIVCPKHGEFVQWKHVHLKEKDNGGGYMGCRKCGFETMKNGKHCERCGARCPNSNNGLCKECTSKKKQDARIRSQTRYECPNCGKRHGKQATKFCSIKCWKENTQRNKLRLECVICGSEVIRYKRRYRGGNVCCSMECAVKYNKILGENRATRPNGRVLRDNWRMKCSRERRANSERYRWWRLCGKQFNFSKDDCEPWVTRCRTSAAGLAGRVRRDSQPVERQPPVDWPDSILRSIERIKSQAYYQRKMSNEWLRKCTNWVSNIKSRRYRVNKAEEESNSKATLPVDRGTRVQMLFEWHEVDSEDSEA